MSQPLSFLKAIILASFLLLSIPALAVVWITISFPHSRGQPLPPTPVGMSELSNHIPFEWSKVCFVPGGTLSNPSTDSKKCFDYWNGKKGFTYITYFGPAAACHTFETEGYYVQKRGIKSECFTRSQASGLTITKTSGIVDIKKERERS
ncbi:MAG: hypothetical protein RIC14_11910 [Filomicrobium sp.]